MIFGVCGDAAMNSAAARAGFDFAEWTVSALLKPLRPEEEFKAVMKELGACPLPYPVANCFVPGEIKITGPEVDPVRLRSFAGTVMQRAEQAGVRVIVFGSGGARRIPDGFARDTAWQQLLDFCGMLAPIAFNHGVTVVVEPLNQGECNVLNTVGECAGLVRQVGHNGVRLLVDAYHLLRDGDSVASMVENGDLLLHSHIATVPERLPPAAEPCDFAPFFSALSAAGYDFRVSIEARISDPEKELPAALSLMTGLADGAG